MPCTYTGTIEGDRLMASQEVVTELTQHLCKVLTSLEMEVEMGSNEWFKIVPDSVHSWWQSHKKVDAVRIARELREAREQIKQNALNRLSEAEKEALGLNKAK